MTQIALLLAMLSILTACNKEDTVNPDFIGKWEAEYSIPSNSDTIFYKTRNFPCAYVVIPGDYNSGFELIDETNGELIWCGGNKGQFFTWSFENDIMKFNFKNKEYEIPVEKHSENMMQITVNGEKYHMRKF